MDYRSKEFEALAKNDGVAIKKKEKDLVPFLQHAARSLAAASEDQSAGDPDASGSSSENV